MSIMVAMKLMWLFTFKCKLKLDLNIKFLSLIGHISSVHQLYVADSYSIGQYKYKTLCLSQKVPLHNTELVS